MKMSMFIESEKGITMGELDTAMRLGVYLSGAVEAMGSAKSNSDAEKLMDQYMAKKQKAGTDLKAPSKSAAKKILDRMEENNNKEIADTPLKTKLKYMYETNKDMSKAIICGAAAVVTGVMASQGMDAMASVSVLAGAGFVSCFGYGISGVGQDQEAPVKTKSDLAEYAELKHTQIALRKMKEKLFGKEKSSYKDEVKNLMASGLGNPGGFVTALNLKSNQR